MIVLNLIILVLAGAVLVGMYARYNKKLPVVKSLKLIFKDKTALVVLREIISSINTKVYIRFFFLVSFILFIILMSLIFETP